MALNSYFVFCVLSLLRFASGGSVERSLKRLQDRARDHEASMQLIMANLSVSDAFLQLKASGAPAELLDLVHRFFEPTPASLASLRGHRTGLIQLQLEVSAGQGPIDGSGYSGVEKARAMLNQMIEEVQKNYDLEIERCCNYDTERSAVIEQTRQDVSTYNALSAAAREEILSAQQGIDACNEKIPRLQEEFEQSKKKCDAQRAALQSEIGTLDSDTQVIQRILNMTQCDQRTVLLACVDDCGVPYTSFHSDDINSALMSVTSGAVRARLLTNLHAIAQQTGKRDEEPVDAALGLLQQPASVSVSIDNHTSGSGVPLPPPPPVTKLATPCKRPTSGDQKTTQCSVKTNPNCLDLQSKFSHIRDDMIDKKLTLLDSLKALGEDCDKEQNLIEAQRQATVANLGNFQKMLAGATVKQNDADEGSRLKGKQFTELNDHYAQTTADCHANYLKLESEECGLKKIRGEMSKIATKAPAFFQDCEVSAWMQSEDGCSKSCDGGIQKFIRTVVTLPRQGAGCPALEKLENCNSDPCPIDCKLADWEGWGECSAKCGGGVRQRIRATLTEPKYGGRACDATSQTEACNNDACDRDCVLHDWTDYSECSNMCGGGISTRLRHIKFAAVGNGKCQPEISHERVQSKDCNTQRCTKKDTTFHCESKVDVVLVLDSSYSIGSYGYSATKAAGALLARSFNSKSKPAQVMLAALQFSYQLEWLMHFTNDTEAVAQAIERMRWLMSTTDTAGALFAARAELPLSGRQDAQRIVVLVTDGYPNSQYYNVKAAEQIREAGVRLIVVPVTQYAPIALSKQVASQPWEQNVFPLASFAQLSTTAFVDTIIEKACPQVS